MTNRLDNLYVSDTLAAKKFTPPTGCIGDDAVKSGDPIDGLKLQHGLHPVYAQESATASVSETRVVLVANAGGTLLAFAAGCVVANVGDSTISMDLKKNGVSVLTAAVSLDSAQTARQTVAGTISGDGVYVAGDVFEVAVTVAAGTGTLGKGVFAGLVAIEDPQ